MENYAYVDDWDTRLRIIDITHPEVPTAAGAYNTIGTTSGLVILRMQEALSVYFPLTQR